MADFRPIQNEFLNISSNFNENINDNFGNSIVNEILNPVNNILNNLSIVEENEKKIKILEVEEMLLEARAILL